MGAPRTTRSAVQSFVMNAGLRSSLQRHGPRPGDELDPEAAFALERRRMPSLLHEGLIDLFRNRPSLAAELLRDVLHAPVPPFADVRVGEANLTDLAPAEFRADLVLLLAGLNSARPHTAVVVEVQLGLDPDKKWSWPGYVTTQRSRLRCDVILLVVTDDAAVAAWAAKPIETGHPGFTLTPLVLGPGSVPMVQDEEEATRRPELAVLSVLVYGQKQEAVAIAKAALAGTRGLDADRAALYIDLVLAFVNDATRGVLEDLMASGTYQYQSDFAKRYVAQGEAQGEARGRLAGLRGAVTTALSARSLPLSEVGRARLAACADEATLTRWLARAVTASSEGDVFGGSEAP